jgi:lactate permease
MSPHQGGGFGRRLLRSGTPDRPGRESTCSEVLDPLGSIPGDTLLALVPVAVLLFLLAVLRMPAWRAVIIGSAVTIILGIFVWDTPVGATFASYGLGAATGVWSVDWIVFWGVVVYNTLVVTGAFGDFKGWLVRQATADIRVQTLLLAWSFGALMEGWWGSATRGPSWRRS